MAARRGRPRKFRDKGGPLYEDDTPIDEATGAPPEEALIPDDQARNMAMDAESSRMNAQHQTVVRKKQQGVPMTQWSPDPRIKYGEIYRFHPGAKVVIRMIEPYDDDNIPTRYLSQLSNYDKLIQHIKDTHWQGKQAAYKWGVCEDGGRVWGTGVIKFGPQRDETAHQQQHHQQNPMMGGQPQYYGQQWGYPPPQQMYQPQQMYPQQQMYPPQFGEPVPQAQPTQQAPAAQPAPQSPYAPHPDVLTGLLGHIERLTNTVIEQKQQVPHFAPAPVGQAPQQPSAPPGYIAQIPWHMMGQLPPQVVAQIPAHLLPYIFGNGYVPVPQQQPQPAQPAQPPVQQQVPHAPPLSPIDAAREAMTGVKEMMRMGREFAQFANPDAPDDPESPAATPPDPDPSPLQVQDIGLTRFVRDRETGQMVESDGLSKILMSGDKIGAVFSTIAEKAIGTVEKRQEMVHKAQAQAIDNAKQLAAVQREIAESQERIARAKAIQAAAETSMRASQPQFAPPPSPPPPQQQYVQPPPPPSPPTPPAPPPPQQFIVAPPWATVNSSSPPPVQTEPAPPPLATWPPTATDPVPPPEPVQEEPEPEQAVVMRPIMFVRPPTTPQNGAEEKKDEPVEEPPQEPPQQEVQ